MLNQLSVQFSLSVMSNSLRPHGLQHTRPPCPSPIPGAYSNSSIESVMPSNHLFPCHPFSSCLQSFPASGSFPMNQFFTSGGQSIGVSASPSVLLMNFQDWFPLGWTGWISLQSKGLSRVFNTIKSINSSALRLTRQTFIGKVTSLLFNRLSRLVIAFLPRSQCLLISWLQSPSAVNLHSD